MRWHYSKRMPKSKMVRVGVWERGAFRGVILFSYGATPEIGSPFGLTQVEICELTRVAMMAHEAPISRMIAIAIKMLRKQSPGLRLVVSFADMAQGHHGGIYQAAGWLYLGAKEYHAYRVNGVVVHPRTLYDRYGVGGQSVPWLRSHVDLKAERIRNGVKHKYAFPLDAEMRSRIAGLSQPYPKRAGSIATDALAHQAGEGGVTPTPALQVS